MATPASAMDQNHAQVIHSRFFDFAKLLQRNQATLLNNEKIKFIFNEISYFGPAFLKSMPPQALNAMQERFKAFLQFVNIHSSEILQGAQALNEADRSKFSAAIQIYIELSKQSEEAIALSFNEMRTGVRLHCYVIAQALKAQKAQTVAQAQAQTAASVASAAGAAAGAEAKPQTQAELDAHARANAAAVEAQAQQQAEARIQALQAEALLSQKAAAQSEQSAAGGAQRTSVDSKLSFFNFLNQITPVRLGIPQKLHFMAMVGLYELLHHRGLKNDSSFPNGKIENLAQAVREFLRACPSFSRSIHFKKIIAQLNDKTFTTSLLSYLSSDYSNDELNGLMRTTTELVSAILSQNPTIESEIQAAVVFGCRQQLEKTNIGSSDIHNCFTDLSQCLHDALPYTKKVLNRRLVSRGYGAENLSMHSIPVTENDVDTHGDFAPRMDSNDMATVRVQKMQKKYESQQEQQYRALVEQGSLPDEGILFSPVGGILTQSLDTTSSRVHYALELMIECELRAHLKSMHLLSPLTESRTNKERATVAKNVLERSIKTPMLLESNTRREAVGYICALYINEYDPNFINTISEKLNQYEAAIAIRSAAAIAAAAARPAPAAGIAVGRAAHDTGAAAGATAANGATGAAAATSAGPAAGAAPAAAAAAEGAAPLNNGAAAGPTGDESSNRPRKKSH